MFSLKQQSKVLSCCVVLFVAWMPLTDILVCFSPLFCCLTPTLWDANMESNPVSPSTVLPKVFWNNFWSVVGDLSVSPRVPLNKNVFQVWDLNFESSSWSMLPNHSHLLNHHSFMMFYAKDGVIFPVFFFTFQSQSGYFINAVTHEKLM